MNRGFVPRNNFGGWDRDRDRGRGWGARVGIGLGAAILGGALTQQYYDYGYAPQSYCTSYQWGWNGYRYDWVPVMVSCY